MKHLLAGAGQAAEIEVGVRAVRSSDLPDLTRAIARARPSFGRGLREPGSNRAMLLAGVAGASVMAGMPCFAATSDAAATGAPPSVAELVVTATKMGSTAVLKAPISVQAISGLKLQAEGETGFMDVAGEIPGLSIEDLGPGDRKYVMRGITSVGESTTGVYYDEAVISGSNANDGGGFEPDIRMYDLSRIEVLRGPQGTLYGAGSMSGTIRFITNKPNLTDFGGYITGEVSDTSHGSANYDADGEINLPIVAGKAALRLVGWELDDSGYIDQIRVGAGTPDPLGLVKGVNNDRVQGGRVSLRVEPIDNLTIDATYTNQQENSAGSSRYTPPGVMAFQIAGTPPTEGCDLCNTDANRSPWQDHLWVLGLTINYKTPWGTLTGTTNQYDRHYIYNIDNTTILNFIGFPINAEAQEPTERRVNSSEIRFASDLHGPVNFVVGGFREYETDYLQVALITTNGQGYPTGPFSPLNSEDAFQHPGVGDTLFGRTDFRRTIQYAGFGEATWTVTPKLKLTGGLRYFWEHLEGVQEQTHPFGGFPPSESGVPVPNQPASYSKVTYKFNVNYQFNDELLLYATVSSGFRGGGLNPEGPIFPVPPSFGPDSLWNYEIGAKGTLFDHRLDYQVDAYLIYWNNIQVNLTTNSGAANYTGNAGDAVSKGFEFEFQARPIHYLTVDLAGSYQDAHLTKGSPPDQRAANPTLGATGDQLPDVAPFQFALGLTYAAPLALPGNWTGTLGADITYRGRANAYFAANPFNITLDPYTLLNLRAGVSNGTWTATAFLDNVSDARAQISAINSPQDPHALLTVRPRTVGLRITRNF
ncbi:MAG TPA: TonB-dependent receptor [Caulobacteraceae bacterium]|nr:TonB-dependent receptor [Caulobacteraceae bacterium]